MNVRDTENENYCLCFRGPCSDPCIILELFKKDIIELIVYGRHKRTKDIKELIVYVFTEDSRKTETKV